MATRCVCVCLCVCECWSSTGLSVGSALLSKGIGGCSGCGPTNGDTTRGEPSNSASRSIFYAHSMRMLVLISSVCLCVCSFTSLVVLCWSWKVCQEKRFTACPTPWPRQQSVLHNNCCITWTIRHAPPHPTPPHPTPPTLKLSVH